VLVALLSYSCQKAEKSRSVSEKGRLSFMIRCSMGVEVEGKEEFEIEIGIEGFFKFEERSSF
jgi:hypothetical protein